MKKFISKALLISTIISAPVLTFAQTDIQNGGINQNKAVSISARQSNEDFSSLFDEYGIRKDSMKLGSSNEDIVQLEKSTNVSLDKMWTITFTGVPTNDNVYSMTIQKDNEYIPVRIKLEIGNKATVTPVSNYDSSSNYVVKIVLNNGKRYEKSFTTTTEDNLVETEEKYFAFKDGVITGYSDDGPKDLVVIPREISGEKVTTIGEKAFHAKGLSKVIIPNTVTEINSGSYTWEGAFAKNNLTEVVIPDSVEKIGDLAFAENRISKLKLSNNMVNIAPKSFSKNVLSKVIIPESVKNIGSEAFASNRISELIIPNTTTNIGDSAFKHNNLTQLTISPGITNVGSYAFANNSLTQLNIPETVNNIESFAFTENKLTKIIIPNSITSIAEGAFSHNMLVNIELPDSVTSIGNRAFQNNKIVNIIIPNSVTTITGGKYTWDGAFSNNYIKNLVIPSSITSIDSYTFHNNQIEELIIPDSVTSIDFQAFTKNQIKEVSLKDSTVYLKNSFDESTIVNKK